ncbi:MAG: PIN domain-containing protein [Acidobacteria bacterium]|nr:PIN domain-containing protein [Acidobacteriota bacterium]NIM60963.1 PIN domain-containing protein [Acidobacteriota bacterium]NIO60453.1 PIN domain-containing protein [Acidobacteriota bacterium]NIQ31551.1 PIN domain-containing protein [Acidobacteriota bacterium]NIQ86803.1 PIN domain-containing protein [Acidobacteriota bacterium]
MNLFVDTSVWSLALRRSRPQETPEVDLLATSLRRGDLVVTTGLVLQELLQGFHGPRARKTIIERFSMLPAITPDLDDHIGAADLRNRCRRKGLQVGTIDALLARLCIRHDLAMLTTDRDFAPIAVHCGLKLAGA